MSSPFEDAAQRRAAGVLGVWIFLLTEVLFFGGAFAGYATYRFTYPDAFLEGSRHLDRLLGSANTAVLLTSSLTMALGVRAASLGRARACAAWLAATALLGAGFLGVKGVEWAHKAHAGLFPGSFTAATGALRLYFHVYYAMTGLHALHVAAGVGVLLWAAAEALRGTWTSEYHTPVEGAGLYWHLVDIVWIFLFPLLYLVGAPQ